MLEDTRKLLNRLSIRGLQRWLEEVERKHPEFINTESMIKDELRKREQRKVETRK